VERRKPLSLLQCPNTFETHEENDKYFRHSKVCAMSQLWKINNVVKVKEDFPHRLLGAFCFTLSWITI